MLIVANATAKQDSFTLITCSPQKDKASGKAIIVDICLSTLEIVGMLINYLYLFLYKS